MVGHGEITDPESVPTELKGRLTDRPTTLFRPRLTALNYEVKNLGGNTYLITGEKPLRWLRQTDFGNDEAVGFLADRLARLGVEQRLVELGAQAGDDVLIGAEDDAVVFDFEPQVAAGAEILHGPRGQDRRLDGR